MDCPKDVTAEARQRLKKHHEELANTFKSRRGGFGGDRGGGRGGGGVGRGGGVPGAQGGAKREKEASCLAIDFAGPNILSLYCINISRPNPPTGDQVEAPAALDFDYCDGTGEELDQTRAYHPEYPTNTCSFALPSSGVDLNEDTPWPETDYYQDSQDLLAPYTMFCGPDSEEDLVAPISKVNVLVDNGIPDVMTTPKYPTNTVHFAAPSHEAYAIQKSLI